MFEGQLKGTLRSQRQHVETLYQFCLGTRSFTEKETVESSRDYDLLIYRSLLKRPRFVGHDCFFPKATKVGDTLEVYMCKCFIFSFFFVFLLNLLNV